jgi:Protein of unknown function (DUF3634)
MSAEFITNIIGAAIGLVVVCGLWRAYQPGLLFTVRLIDGKAEATTGTVTQAFLNRVSEVANGCHASKGAIHGYARGKHIRLKFSAEMPEESRQLLRNWWVEFGWPAPKSTDRAIR